MRQKSFAELFPDRAGEGAENERCAAEIGPQEAEAGRVRRGQERKPSEQQQQQCPQRRKEQWTSKFAVKF